MSIDTTLIYELALEAGDEHTAQLAAVLNRFDAAVDFDDEADPAMEGSDG